jgi:hypothetical protein
VADGHSVAERKSVTIVRETVIEIATARVNLFVFREVVVDHCLHSLSVKVNLRLMSTIVSPDRPKELLIELREKLKRQLRRLLWPKQNLPKTKSLVVDGHSVADQESVVIVRETVILIETAKLATFVFRDLGTPNFQHLLNVEEHQRIVSTIVLPKMLLLLKPIRTTPEFRRKNWMRGGREGLQEERLGKLRPRKEELLKPKKL